MDKIYMSTIVMVRDLRTGCPKPRTVPKNVMINNGLSWSVGKGLLLVISSNKMVNARDIPICVEYFMYFFGFLVYVTCD